MRPLCLAAFVFLAACQTVRDPGESAVLSADQFEDLPAPRNARYRDRNAESFSYRGQTFRCGQFLYDFEGQQVEATRFFVTTMTAPPYNWTLLDEDRPAAGSTTLVFTKNNDRCTVDIDRTSAPDRQPEQVVIHVRLNYRR